MAGAAVAQIVAVDTGNHHIGQLELGDGFGQVVGLVGIERVGPAMADIAKRATPGAFVAHDHEGRRALAKALADVGAGGLFTHGYQLVGAQDVLDLIKPGARAAGFDANPVGLFQHLTGLHLDRDAREFVTGFLLDARVVGDDGFRVAHGVGAAHGDPVVREMLRAAGGRRACDRAGQPPPARSLRPRL